ncbi:MAG TPA: hypothetical protein VN696_02630 [Pyrinomonadaceae bacterium]|nr:hypothetical protein [Pyrinomonadaceae bacterium]
MNIRYRNIPDKDAAGGYAVIPLLQVFLRHDINMRPFLALVDSGANACIFPESVGTLLGIDVPSGRPHSFYGLANQEAPGFMHRVQLQVTGIPIWVEIEAGFVTGENILPLLGQAGFFENFQVVFERYKRQFEINTKTDALIRNRRGHGRGR